MKHTAFILISVLFFTLPAMAQTSSDSPIEITADNALEWQREEQLYIARGAAIAKQDETELHGETLTAAYREQDGATTIWQITAETNVEIHAPPQTAYGQKAVYDIDSGVAVLTGTGLRIVTPGEIITARDKIEYHRDSQRMIAYGKARAVKGTDKLEGDRLTGIFGRDANGKQVLHRIEARGNVTITTPQEVVRGNYGVYNTAEEKATLLGNVKVFRGPNRLSGERAEVNLATGTSQLFATVKENNPAEKGRVTGIFYPESNKKNKDEQ